MRLVQVEQDRADGVLPHRPDAVGEDEPALLRLDRGAAVAELDQLPGALWHLDGDGLAPAVTIGGVSDGVALSVPPGQRGILASDPAGDSAMPLLLADAPASWETSKVRKSLVCSSCGATCEPSNAV